MFAGICLMSLCEDIFLKLKLGKKYILVPYSKLSPTFKTSFLQSQRPSALNYFFKKVERVVNTLLLKIKRDYVQTYKKR